MSNDQGEGTQKDAEVDQCDDEVSTESAEPPDDNPQAGDTNTHSISDFSVSSPSLDFEKVEIAQTALNHSDGEVDIAYEPSDQLLSPTSPNSPTSIKGGRNDHDDDDSVDEWLDRFCATPPVDHDHNHVVNQPDAGIVDDIDSESSVDLKELDQDPSLETSLATLLNSSEAREPRTRQGRHDNSINWCLAEALSNRFIDRFRHSFSATEAVTASDFWGCWTSFRSNSSTSVDLQRFLQSNNGEFGRKATK